MRVKCILEYPTDQHFERLGDLYRRQAFGVTVGKKYVVLGVAFHINLPGFGTGVQIQFVNDNGNIGFAPLFLFEIIDGRPSRHWEARFDEDGSFQLQPSSFYKKYYHDDLSDGVEEVVEDFNRVRGLLEDESVGEST